MKGTHMTDFISSLPDWTWPGLLAAFLIAILLGGSARYNRGPDKGTQIWLNFNGIRSLFSGPTGKAEVHKPEPMKTDETPAE
jgi:hypothetical protein